MSITESRQQRTWQVDDIIVAAADEQEHDQIMVKLLQRAREGNVKNNTAKFQYKVSKAKYMGNIASESGLNQMLKKCAP